MSKYMLFQKIIRWNHRIPFKFKDKNEDTKKRELEMMTEKNKDNENLGSESFANFERYASLYIYCVIKNGMDPF